MIRYWLVTAYGPEQLNKQVNDFVKQGWQPHGSPCVLQASKGPVYHQSVTMSLSDSEYDDVVNRQVAIDEMEGT